MTYKQAEFWQRPDPDILIAAMANAAQDAMALLGRTDFDNEHRLTAMETLRQAEGFATSYLALRAYKESPTAIFRNWIRDYVDLLRMISRCEAYLAANEPVLEALSTIRQRTGLEVD